MTPRVLVEPIWLQHARKDTGLTEIPGPKSATRILEMARAIGAPAWFHDDDQPWCAVAQNAWLIESGQKIATGTRGDFFDRLRALTFHTQPYGQGLVKPALGAIGVFARPEGAHVGMYLGETVDRFYIFGGNQRNRVGETWVERSRLKSWRWPPDAALPTSLAPIQLTANGVPLSVNEA